MKKAFLFIIILIGAILAAAQQDNNNIIYLDNLDNKLIDTIDMIVAFNKAANNMTGSIKGAQEFSGYLLDLTVDISSLRMMITESLDQTPAQRENTIRNIMAQIQPGNIEPQSNIDPNQDKDNIKYLDQRLPRLLNQLNSYRSKIIDEENTLIEKGAVTERYLSLHNRHFVYQILYSFMIDHRLLSPANRQFLVELIKLIDLSIYNQEL
jgi:hypothetical protein